MASPTSTSTSPVLLLVLVALAGLADLAAAARPVDAALSTANTMASAAGGAAELDGMMECMVGCFTQVLGCAFGCMGKGPDLPLCVISCNQKSIVCMVRCGISPSPPAPKPTPPKPKPKPSPPPGPPYAGHSTENSC